MDLLRFFLGVCVVQCLYHDKISIPYKLRKDGSCIAPDFVQIQTVLPSAFSYKIGEQLHWKLMCT